MPDHVNGTGRQERIEAAVALVNRAMCLAESEGLLGAAFAGDLEKAIRSVRAGIKGKSHTKAQP
ncbi:hypothetical protein [Rhizorhapis suberifaciens]|uniref:Uncharacterized protein n=1 Tax=Rhizorhapis suberifaciens TaxID=13656 RepID=A0A840HYT7_9SPHN|nr:hypothetical protein [Rhizorhapis suberifaciens]MBB4642730.1 hypothetical protein [Rhizorhapis suberifaciens]